MMKRMKKNKQTGNQGFRGGRLRKMLSGFLAVACAVSMMSGNVSIAMADDLSTELMLAGAGSGQDVTVRFGNGKDQSINLHVNPETSAVDETEALEDAFSNDGVGAETEAETENLAETEADVENITETEAETEVLDETEAETENSTEALDETEASQSDLSVMYVDQFGDLIGEAYQEMPLPSFGEDGVLDLLATDDYKPVSDFAVWQDAASKVIQYSYMRARVNYHTIKAIRIGEPEDQDSSADTQTPYSGINDEEIGVETVSKIDEGAYYYTNNYSQWKKLDNNDIIEFVFTSGKQRVYQFEDENVKVNATLQHAWAIPDGAQLKVTQITPRSDEYNYNAYLDAANENASLTESEETGNRLKKGDKEDSNPRYDESNTLLYDIAFIAVKYDAEGNPLEGSEYEYEPADGSVALSVEFKDSQLTKNLGISKAEDIAVFHMPLSGQVKEGTDTTAQATDISSTDITVESINLDSTAVSLEEGAMDSVSFDVNSFSVFLFSSDGQHMTWTGSRQFTMVDILSNLDGLTNYAVAAKRLETKDHIEGNIRVGTFVIAGSPELNQGVFEYNNPKEFTVVKTVEGGDNASNNKTYNFVIMDEDTNKKLYSFSLKPERQNDGMISASMTFTDKNAPEVFKALNPLKHTIQVYEYVDEPDGTRRLLKNGEKHGDMIVTYNSISSADEAGEIGNSGKNYIGDFEPQNQWANHIGDNVLGSFVCGIDPVPRNNHVYFGDFYVENGQNKLNINPDYYSYEENLKETICSQLDNAKRFSEVLASAYNGDTESAGSKNYGSDLNVINLISEDGSLRSDLDKAGFKLTINPGNRVDDKGVIKDLINQGKYLLINIDVGDRKSYSIDGEKLYYDGRDSQNKTVLGAHIIYNLVSSTDNQKTFKPFTGTVNVTNNSAGLLLAPAAKVDQTWVWEGEIIADEVIHGTQEIHKVTVVSGIDKKIKVDIVNSYSNETEIEVKKVWEGTRENESLKPVSFELWYVLGPVAKYTGASFGFEDLSAGVEGETRYGAGSYTLSTSNRWQTIIDDLPIYNYEEAEVRQYYYFVKEVSAIDGYTTYYNNNVGISRGKITILNKKTDTTSITVTKIWKDENNNQLSQDEINELSSKGANFEAHITLYRRKDIPGSTTPSKVDGSEVILTLDKLTHTWSNLPLKDSRDGAVYKYYVKEDEISDFTTSYIEHGQGDAPGYGKAVENEEGEGLSVTVVNSKKVYYSMPATGGEGTRSIYLVSLTLIALAGMGLVMIRRRKYIEKS